MSEVELINTTTSSDTQENDKKPFLSYRTGLEIWSTQLLVWGLSHFAPTSIYLVSLKINAEVEKSYKTKKKKKRLISSSQRHI